RARGDEDPRGRPTRASRRPAPARNLSSPAETGAGTIRAGSRAHHYSFTDITPNHGRACSVVVLLYFWCAKPVLFRATDHATPYPDRLLHRPGGRRAQPQPPLSRRRDRRNRGHRLLGGLFHLGDLDERARRLRPHPPDAAGVRAATALQRRAGAAPAAA